MTWHLSVNYNGDELTAQQISSTLWDNNTSGLVINKHTIIAGFEVRSDAEAAQSILGGAIAKYQEVTQPSAGMVNIAFGAETLNLDLNTSSSFGHGNHPTTRLCLDTLGELATLKSFLDIGTGSGILSIAMAKSGCNNVVAIDSDPKAVRQAMENIATNQVSVAVSGEDVSKVEGQFDCIAANMLLTGHREIARAIPALLADGGIFVTAGVLVDQAQELIGCYPDLTPISSRTSDKWLSVTFSRRHIED